MALGWNDLDGLVDALRVAHPRVDPRALEDVELNKLVEALDGYESSGYQAGPGDFEALRATWHWGA
jgi:FeS assembly protein IscX